MDDFHGCHKHEQKVPLFINAPKCYHLCMWRSKERDITVWTVDKLSDLCASMCECDVTCSYTLSQAVGTCKLQFSVDWYDRQISSASQYNVSQLVGIIGAGDRK